ncbi:MAG: glycosyltransferase family 4 protein [Terracidiphilus sp.]
MMSYTYPPATGGIETFSSLMREAFAARGHEVRVVTEIERTMPEDAAHRVLRRPGRAALKQAISWADLCAVCGLSLHYQVPVLLGGKPLTITHQVWQESQEGAVDWRNRLRLFICRFGLNIAVNSVLARDLRMPALTIPNPLPGEIDLGPETASRPRDVVFVGRLVSEKGVPVLLDAIARLHQRGRDVTATIIGDGPLRADLEGHAASLNLQVPVEFLGRMAPADFHPILRQHKIIVVPSVYREAFGIVTLEGLAAGCMVLVSNAGGLPEVVGQCGLTFPMRDSGALAGSIEQILANPETTTPYRKAVPAHLESMRPERLAERYLAVFERLHFYHTVKGIGRRKAIRRTVDEISARS